MKPRWQQRTRAARHDTHLMTVSGAKLFSWEMGVLIVPRVTIPLTGQVLGLGMTHPC